MAGALYILLRWGGLGLALMGAVALLWGLFSGAPASSDPGAPDADDMPYLLYLGLLALGALMAGVGFAHRRRTGDSGVRSRSTTSRS